MIEIISATRLSEEVFWKNAALGLSLKKLEHDTRLVNNISFANTAGLPDIYNTAINHSTSEYLVFIHDDIWIDDTAFVDKIIEGLEHYDIIGVVGNKYCTPKQPSWYLATYVEGNNYKIDAYSNFSGIIAHGQNAFGEITHFGPVPASCEIMDGLFFAVKKETLLSHNVYFDPRFQFHFYDLDFCRTARLNKLNLGTWDIRLTHQSTGTLGSAAWRKTYSEYLAKWETVNSEEPLHNNVTIEIGNILNQAITAHNQGNLPQAENLYKQLLVLDPNHFDALHMLGLVRKTLGFLSEGLSFYDKAAQVRADIPALWCNRGVTLFALAEYEQAIQSYDKALALQVDYPTAWNNRGNALSTLKRYDDALDSFNKALFYKPDYADAWANKGQVLTDIGHLNDAELSYKHVLDIMPQRQETLGQVAYLQARMCQWYENENLASKITTFLNQGLPVTSPFNLLSLHHLDAQTQLKASQCFIKYKWPTLLEQPPMVTKFPVREKADGEPIRIAYLSADFHHHATSMLMVELFENHDKNRFEMYALSFSPNKPSALRDRIVRAFDTRFVDVNNLSDEQVARWMADHKIDIAVDLKGFTGESRFGIFLYRGAPIQVNYLGYPATTGSSCIDYIIGDKWVTPFEQQASFSEKIVQMPHSYQVNDRQKEISKNVPHRTALGLPETGFVFCCFNNNWKITPQVFDIWMRLLAQVPDSVLWLLGDNPIAEANLRKEAEARQISSSRIIFAPRTPLADHLARHQQADLFLDTWPCNAHTTASDALWAGLPVLTRTDHIFAGRVAASLLDAIDLPELITTTPEAYETLALDLAKNPEKLLALRQKLSRNLSTAPLFNTIQFTRDLESAYISMWQRYQQNLKPESFSVTSQKDASVEWTVSAIQPPPTTPRIDPNLFAIAATLYQQGNPTQALEHINAALPEQEAPHILNLAAACALSLKQFSLAETYWQRAIELEPSYITAYNNLGILFKDQHRFSDAQAILQQATLLQPNYADAHYNLGIVLAKTEQMSAAEVALNKAIELRTDYADAYIQLGNILLQQKRISEAEIILKRAINTCPKNADVYNNLGLVYLALYQYKEALNCFDAAIAITPNHTHAWNNRGLAFTELNQPLEALESYNALFKLQPDYRGAVGQAMFIRTHHCLWHNWQQHTHQLVTLLEQGKPVGMPLGLFTLPEIDASLQRKAAFYFTQTQWDIRLIPKLIDHKNRRIKSSGEPLRIGYLSPDFGNHPVTHLIMDVLAAHNLSHYHITLYSYGSRPEGEERQRLQKYVSKFVQIDTLNDQEAAERIADDGIDILVDLAGQTKNSRLDISIRRPAPIIVSWLGYIGTLGEPLLADYIIGDATATPFEHADHFSEAIVQMPHCFQPNQQLKPLQALPSRKEMGLPENAIVLCSFNQSFKLNPTLWDDWCQILKATPNTILWLAPMSVLAQQNLKQEAESRGVLAERIIFAARLSLAAHQTRIQLADLALDTFPYGSGTTGSDVLRAGVPLITRMGDTFVSRMAGSLLNNLGLRELITTDRQAYINLAIHLIQHPIELQNIRKKQAEALLSSPLFNPTLFCKNLESAYTMMWQRYSNNLNPEGFIVETELTIKKMPLSSYELTVTSPTPPVVADAFSLAVPLFQTGQFKQALSLIESALPTQESPHLVNLAAASAHALNDAHNAEKYWQRAIQLKPDYATVYSNLGLLLKEQQRYTEAVHTYQKVTELMPDSATAFVDLGNIYAEQKTFAEAEKAYLQAIHLEPNNAKTFNNLGLLYAEHHYNSKAEIAYKQALLLDPNYRNAQLNLSLLLLKLGNYNEGWPLFETRYTTHNKIQGFSLPTLSYPQWQGESLQGKSILIWREQGFGDEIQFCRYARLLKEAGAKYITIACKPALGELFASLDHVDSVFSEASTPPVHDYWTYPMSIPYLLKTTLETIPSQLPYLYANPSRLVQWQAQLPHTEKLKVGLIWKGSMAYINDQRTLPHLSILAPLWDVKAITFISLQKGHAEDEAKQPPENQPLLHLGSDIENFADAAAIISQLDLVICVDTAFAHLAGALGKSCWVLLPAVGTDWRWLENRNDSPWYPNTVRLFRQTTPHHWEETIQQVKQALLDWATPPTLHKKVITVSNLPQPDMAVASNTTENPFTTMTTLYHSGKYADVLAFAKTIALSYPTLELAAKSAEALQQWSEAVQYWQQAVLIRPHAEAIHYKLGILLTTLNRLEEAQQAYLQAISINTHHVDAYFGLAITYKSQQHLEDAKEAYLNVLALNPHHNAAIYNLANLLKEQRYFTEAENTYRQVPPSSTYYADALNNLGLMLTEQQHINAAIDCYDQALAIKPTDVNVWNNRGNALITQGKLDDALANFNHAIAIQPNFFDFYCNKGVLLYNLQRYEEAIESCDQALAIAPHSPEAWINRGRALLALEKNSDAEIAFKQAIALKPAYPDAQFNLAFLLLKVGRYAEAWPLYEARYHPNKQKRQSIPPVLPFPQWQGESLQGKSIVVWHEQGFGDDIQFIRYLPHLRQHGATHITLVCKPALKRLFLSSDADVVISDHEKNIAHHDFWTFLISIPRHTGATLANIPTPPYLSATPEIIQDWQPKLATKNLKVGLVWKGHAGHQNDHHRSLPHLTALAPLWRVPNIQFFSLQKGQAEDEALNPPKNQPMVALGTLINDFADSAAIVSQLDLIIAVDTAIVHLAGALGKPCWVLLPKDGIDWRWMDTRTDSPWYPETLRLFRQKATDQWDVTIQEVTHALQTWQLKELEKTTPKSITTGDCFNTAVAFYQTGNYAQALATIEESLPAQEAPHILNLAAACAHALKQWDIAEHHWLRATQLNPDFAEAYNNLGILLKDQGRIHDAEKYLRQAIQCKPNFADAFYNLGTVLIKQERLKEAESTLKQAQTLAPTDARILLNIANIYNLQQRYNEAENALHQTLALNPNYAEALNNLGNILAEQQKYDAAEATYNKCLAISPNYCDAYNNLGNLLQAIKRITEAESAYLSAIKINPNYANAYINLGNLYRDQNYFDKAEHYYQQALTLQPKSLETYNNLGLLHHKKRDYSAAIGCFKQALEINPRYAAAINNEAVALHEMGLKEEALACYEHLLTIQPDYPDAAGQVYMRRALFCQWENRASFGKQITTYIKQNIPAVAPFILVCVPEVNAALQLQANQNYVQTHFAHLVNTPKPAIKRDLPASSHPIRIGYVSADFHHHATTMLMVELLELHDRNHFEIYGISYGSDKPSPLRERVINAFDHFIDVRDKTDKEVATWMQAQQIDIAVDLKGHTLDSRFGIFMYHAAPIQVSFLGYPETVGTTVIDYIIGDKWVTPTAFQPYFSEHIIQLPHSYQANDRQRKIDPTMPSKADLGLPENGFIFCCFNSNYKITPTVFDIWMRLLIQIPHSVLWLYSGNKTAESNLKQEAVARGVDATRIIFAPHCELPEHLARQAHADLFLDTWPCNAHTTTSDALWAGLPVLTCYGETFASRVAASLLDAVGLPELITSNAHDYEKLALKLALNKTELDAIRTKLKNNITHSALFNTPQFTRDLEFAYQTIWQRFCRNIPPEGFSVPHAHSSSQAVLP